MLPARIDGRRAGCYNSEQREEGAMGAEFVLSAFGDEIAAELSEQVDALLAEGIHHVEFRAAWGKNVLDLGDAEIARARELLAARGVRVSAVGSPIGKVKITDDFDAHLARFRRAVWVAGQFGAPYIRVFSFFLPAAEAARYRDEVLRRLSALVAEARAAGLTLLHENERDIYGDTPERCRDLLESIGSPYLRATFDPANFVTCGVRPYDDAYPLLREYIAYWHIKDATVDGAVRPAGEGDGQLVALMRAEVARGFRGVASLEPHLKRGGRFAGFSGPALFHTAAGAFKRLLAGIDGAMIS
jgi:sugar phosphate isomerase/epimerase